MSALDILRNRGFVDNVTHEEELQEYFSREDVTCYIGFDPTADSLHVGSLVCLMALAHMQRDGHRPIGLVGGGTGLIGDPSGKTEMRKIITHEQIEENKKGIRKQLERFLDFEDGKALLLDNASWLTGLEYIPFLRDIGRHFSVNRMVKAEGYKTRLDSEEGLNFIEFNYMLLQSYDFMQLAKDHNCLLQMGGSDQWGNIVSGIDLVRRVLNKQAFGITFPLITTSSGIKMGKTHKGAVWLDPARTSPYDYYQYWVNTDDADVQRFLLLFTFLPITEIEKIGRFKGAELNSAKAILAFEATIIAHGRVEADNAFKAAASVFGGFKIPKDLLKSSSIPRKIVASSDESVPSIDVNKKRMSEGVSVVDLFVETSLCNSKSEARRLIKQGGGYVNDIRIESIDKKLFEQDFEDNELLLRAGKKKYHKIILI
ncbi:MAG: tyrosine--tRNA ligase [Desulfobacteraceae bacterium]|nr:tyrosine--tRNA ligase [Desulfobacteraceae bacterium]